MLSSSSLTGMSGLSSRGVLYRSHAVVPPTASRLGGLYGEDDEEDDDDDSTDEYGSCSEAPLYENVHDEDDEDEQGVYENVVFEPPAYSNLLLGDDDDLEHDGQVYANVLGTGQIEDAPTYDVPTRRAGPAGVVHAHQPQEYANLPTAATAAPLPGTTATTTNGNAPVGGGLGVILEESESSARSSSGSSGRGSSCTSAASSLARSGTPAPPAHHLSPASGLSGLLARIRGGVVGSPAPSPSPQVVGLTAKQDADGHRGSRDSGLNDVGVDWSSRGQTPPRTFQDAHQPTPERLARVQQQVRQHLQDDDEGHYQSPRPSPRPKLSVRDLLGHFEAQRAPPSGVSAGGVSGSGAAGALGTSVGAVGRGGVGATNGSAAQQKSYGFGSTAVLKNALRKTVSQPPLESAHKSHRPADDAKSYRTGDEVKSYRTGDEVKSYRTGDEVKSYRTGDEVKSYRTGDEVKSYRTGDEVKSYRTGDDAKSYNSTRKSSFASNPSGVSQSYGSPSVTNNNNKSYGSATPSSNSNNNNINNKSYSTANPSSITNNNKTHNVSRRSFLDSIIAGASSADGSGRLGKLGRTSRRSSGGPTMEETNNATNSVLNAALAPTAAPPAVPHTVPVDRAANGGHVALRKAVSADSAAKKSSDSGREANGSSAQASSREDIPSIVDQLPDDDRPQESRRTTSSWDPSVLVATLYSVPEPLRDKPRPVDRVNVEGFLERLPSGRTKATFWNAWKRCYFRAKDGFLHCYAGKHSDKPMDVTQLMGGLVEPFESMVITAQDRNPATVPVIGIDDRMGHYLVVRANTPQETDRWVRALQTHTVEDFCSTYVQPWPVPRAPAMLRESIVVDLGSRSVRAGILCSQPSLPQVFFPAVCATRRGFASSLGAGDKVYGPAALQPSVRAHSTLSYPIRPSERISKHTVDLAAVAGLLRVVFQSLSVEPRDYGLVLAVPRTLDSATQSRLVADLFDRFGVRSVLLSHQTVLALYAYNAASGVVVDVGERTDVVPIMDGYIVEGGVSRVPYGGEEMSGHVRRFLLQRAPPVSLGTVAEAMLPRLALERLCYVSANYRADLKRAQRDPTEVAAAVSVSEYFATDKEPTMESLTLDLGRFQAPEGLFHPSAWGLDHAGLHRMVHKAIQECSMDARKTMARSVFLAGGLTMLPGFTERLREELATLLPPAAQPKVHASPYRYHAAYLGACVLANSSGVQEMCLSRDEYNRDGGKLLRPWIL